MPSTNNKQATLTLEERILGATYRRLQRFLRTALPHVHKSDLDLVVFKHARRLSAEIMDEIRGALDDYADNLTASQRGRRAPQGGRGKS